MSIHNYKKITEDKMYITLHTLKCTTLRVDDRSTTLDDTEKILMTLKSMNYL